MYKVFEYTHPNGDTPIRAYLKSLQNRADKDARIKANKILDYIDYLEKNGPKAREPYAKHLDGEIWELRPLRDRVLYAAWDGNAFILLHIFMKDTQKTPRREIEQAKRNLADYRERTKGHDKQ
ncbi:MAG: type II toxin-antitoxin system RelE/ParE family toxin [Defluviitaleaceae bacterium]|nr:type II toxin-antitoxin system RelE/ParE family toxin [Defluviitaleaceae bacterium]